jgi:hypothetical protein
MVFGLGTFLAMLSNAHLVTLVASFYGKKAAMETLFEPLSPYLKPVTKNHSNSKIKDSLFIHGSGLPDGIFSNQKSQFG